MKTIAFYRSPEQPVTMPPRVDVIPDSSAVGHGQPMFIPDHHTQWTALVCPAIRICRLGKSISRKFAPRYFNAVTLALRLIPIDIEEEMHALRSPTGIVGLFDNCLQIGEWLPLTDATPALEIECGDSRFSLTDEHFGAIESISAISSYCTLKIGDIILPCHMPLAIPAITDTTVSASLNGTPCLTVRFK